MIYPVDSAIQPLNNQSKVYFWLILSLFAQRSKDMYGFVSFNKFILRVHWKFAVTLGDDSQNLYFFTAWYHPNRWTEIAVASLFDRQLFTFAWIARHSIRIRPI